MAREKEEEMGSEHEMDVDFKKDDERRSRRKKSSKKSSKRSSSSRHRRRSRHYSDDSSDEDYDREDSRSKKSSKKNSSKKKKDSRRSSRRKEEEEVEEEEEEEPMDITEEKKNTSKKMDIVDEKKEIEEVKVERKDEKMSKKQEVEEDSEKDNRKARSRSPKKSSGRKSTERNEESSRKRSRKRSDSKDGRRRRRSRSSSKLRRSRSRSRDRRRRRASSRRSRSRSRSYRSSRRSRRSRSRSRSYRRSRRHSRSRSRSKSKKGSGFSAKPSSESTSNSNAVTSSEPSTAAAMTQLMKQHPTLSLQDIINKIQSSNVTMASAVSMKPARELYVGNLPPNVTAPQLQEFLGTIIQQVGLNTQTGNPILSTWISTDGHFAFCELRSVEENNLALLLNGLTLLGQPMKFGRPKSFMGPPQTCPTVKSEIQEALTKLGCSPNLMWFQGGAASGGIPLATNPLLASLGVSNRLLMMNIPTVLTEDLLVKLVEPFGELSFFNLVKDEGTNLSSGNAIFEYKDVSVIEKAIQGLNGIDIGGQKVSVQRAPNDGTSSASVITPATVGTGLFPQPTFPPVPLSTPATIISGQGQPNSASAPVSVEATPTVVLKLENMVAEEDLKDDEEFAEIKEDIEDECSKYGKVVSIEIPRPSADGSKKLGVGNIFVQFAETSHSTATLQALKGRRFGGKIVKATYFSLDKFSRKEYED